MNVKKNNQGVDMKIKREDDEISIGSQDSYSQRSLGLEPDEYQEDSFLEIKRENLRRKKNLNMDCCRKTLDCHENYFLIKLHKEKREREREKVEKKMNEEIDRNIKNQEILSEIKKCKKAIYKLLKRKWKIQLRYNDDDDEDDDDERVMETRNGQEIQK